MDINFIKPKKKGKSDKFSWQLYEYCRRHAYFGLPKVYYLQTHDSFEGDADVPFDYSNVNPYWTYVGFMSEDGWLTGNRLGTILGDTKYKYTRFADPWLRGKTVVDITEWFWLEYLKSGRCIWDREHKGWLKDDESRFIDINKNSRKCTWCGAWLRRKIVKRVSIERKVQWSVSGKN